ncbi:MAG TPA: hypothetical protein PLG63_02125 [bacterium]|jgi:hypothetical protein|nr:hypothetical protein [bacterium]HPG35108.1 hypothetical protein [bacterium]HPM47657.1 hypothetical protein [bacterium]
MTKNNQITGNIGLYYVCYVLSKKGFNAIPTARNAKGVDIIVYNEDCSKMVGVQVKTLSKRNPVPLGSSKKQSEKVIWVIVNEVRAEKHNTYIMTSEEIEEKTVAKVKNGKTSCWLQPKDYCKNEYSEKWDKIMNKLK